MSDPLLAVESLFAGYEPGVAIVRGANIHVGESEIVAVLGPNGAGKSTLIKAIIGLVPKFAGRVRLADADITQSQAHALVRNTIMGAKTSEDYYSHLAWLYGGTGLSSQVAA